MIEQASLANSDVCEICFWQIIVEPRRVASPLRRIWFLSYAKSAVDTLYLLACNGSKRAALTNNITCHVQ